LRFFPDFWQGWSWPNNVSCFIREERIEARLGKLAKMLVMKQQTSRVKKNYSTYSSQEMDGGIYWNNKLLTPAEPLWSPPQTVEISRGSLNVDEAAAQPFRLAACALQKMSHAPLLWLGISLVYF
jgi:hypothetical protein